MVNAQEWLDINYPQEERSKVEEIYIKENLEGKLDLKKFTCYGVKVLISHTVDENRLQIINQSEKTKIIKFINPQQWLEENYPKEGTCIRKDERKNYEGEVLINNFGKQRAQITELYISKKYLEGQLDLTTFINLKKLDCSDNNLTSLNLSNCPQLKELHCSWNNLTTLDLNNCPQLEKIKCYGNNLNQLNISNNYELKELDCSENKSLTTLTVNNNSKLTKLNCSYCNLTTLNVNNNLHLENLYCSNNQLTELNFSSLPELTTLYGFNNSLTNLQFLNHLNSNKLAKLDISDNNFSPSELTVFSKFINLTNLVIGSENKWKINQDIYNRFTGSLAPLAKLTKLLWLNISNTDLNDGWEYLPNSLKIFYCSSEARPTALVQKLIQELTVYGEPDNTNHAHLLLVWKEEKYYQTKIEVPPKS